jgi:hypothetical protein
MGAHKGKDCKVAIGSTKIVGLGTWTINGITADQLEDTEFGDDWKTFVYGMKDGGQVSFSGYYDKTDSTGQDVIRAANENGTELEDLRFYVDDTSYWRPNSTGTPHSHIIITAWDISADKGNLVQCSFTGKVSGKMDLV